MIRERLTWKTAALTIQIAIIGITVFVLGLLYWPYKPLVVEQPFDIVDEELRPGDFIKYTINSSNDKDITVKFTPQLRGPSSFAFPTGTVNIPAGERSSTTANLVVPPNMIPGTYKVVFNDVVRVNPIREVEFTVESEEFTILPKE